MKSAFGLATAVLLLAVGAAVPVVGFAVLGYLLVIEGRVARGEPWRQAFPLFDRLPPVGGAVLLGWAWLFPVRLLWGATLDARVISPGGAPPKVLLALTVAGGLFVAVHFTLALLRGATVPALLWPPGHLRWLRQRTGRLEVLAKLRDAWRELAPLRLLWLGLRGFLGALVWLAVPAGLWIAAQAGEKTRPGLALLGGLALIPVLFLLPFLQAHFAAEDRWQALFEWKAVRGAFARAPLAWMLALLVTYLFTFPLYLLKVVLPPSDAAWLVTLVFVGTVLPVRLVLAWAWRRAARRPAPVSRWVSWPARLALVPLLGGYALLLFLAPVIDSHGSTALLAHHAFLLPSPF